MTGESVDFSIFEEITLPDGSDPVSKGIVRGVQTENGTVTIRITVDGLGDRLAERIVEQIRGVALTIPDIEHARVVSVSNPDKDVTLPQAHCVVAVASAKGGVGKTTITVGLARTLAAQGLDVGLFDADIYGPNVPHLLSEAEGPVLTDDQGRPVPIEANGVELLSPGVVSGDPPTARRGAIAYGAIENLLSQGAWSDLDILLIDMPAGSDDVVGAVLEHVAVDGAVFVTTPFAASVDDTSRTIELFEENDIPTVAGVVNMNSIECSCCGEETTLFENPVEVDLPVIHHIPFNRALQSDPGGTDAESFLPLAADIQTFLDETVRAIPDEAIDLRGLPVDSSVRQLSLELTMIHSGETVSGIVNEGTDVKDALEHDAAELLEDVTITPLKTADTIIAATRA